MLNIEKLTPEQAELVKSLQELEMSDEDIMKSLNITPEEKIIEDRIEKSVEEQIAEKQIELDRLNQLQDLEKSNKDDLGYGEKFDEIQKSLDTHQNQIEEANKKADERLEGLTNLVKSLTDISVSLKEDNTQLIKDNDDLKKSFAGSEEVLKKLADFTPGLRSASNANQVERFEKSNTEDGMEILSISQNKDEISSRISKFMDTDVELAKSLTDDISSFECSSKITPKLQKIFNEKIAISVVQ